MSVKEGPPVADDESFLSRWSRRKLAQRDQARAGLEPQPSQETATSAVIPGGDGTLPAPDSAAEKSAARKPVTLDELPSFDSLTATSDYSPFLRDGVPENLRRQALRKLWASDPILSAPDPFDLHAFDYNAVPTFPQGIPSLIRAGLGMVQPEEKDSVVTEAKPSVTSDAELAASEVGTADSSAGPEGGAQPTRLDGNVEAASDEEASDRAV